MNNTVIVQSMVNGDIGINVPEIGLRAEWAKKGVKRTLDLEKLKQAMYDPGVENLFKEGVLYIEDMEQKIELGLEPPEASEPTLVKVIDDKLKVRLLTLMPLQEFKNRLKEYPLEQIIELANYAIEHDLIDLDKDKVLQDYTQINIVSAIQLKRSLAED